MGALEQAVPLSQDIHGSSFVLEYTLARYEPVDPTLPIPKRVRVLAQSARQSAADDT